MDDGREKFERITDLAMELGAEILRLAASKEDAFRLIRTAAIAMQVRVELGINAPKFRGRLAAEQNERLGELGIDPVPILADRPIGGD